MKVLLLTVCSARHQNFAEKLYSEVLLHCKQECKIAYLDNSCEGDFQSEAFFNACYNKILFIITELESLQCGDALIYLDSDICVKGNIVTTMLEELGDSHIAFQQDSKNALCAGLFACRVCPETINFFNNVKEALIRNKEYYVAKECDQTVINEMLPHSGLKYIPLSLKFTTYGNLELGLWSPDSPHFVLDSDVLTFHANFTIGLHNKTQLLNLVRSQ